MEKEYSLEDLSRRSGLPTRTLRYYMQEGLVPGPDTAGKYASYSQRHLDHLLMIRRLKKLHLPLKEIRHLIKNMTAKDMKRILQYQDTLLSQKGFAADEQITLQNSDQQSSALEYIRQLEQRQSNLHSIAESPPSFTQNTLTSVQYSQAAADQSKENFLAQRESWSKFVLTDGVELHIRQDAATTRKKDLVALLKSAGQLFRKNKQEEENNG